MPSPEVLAIFESLPPAPWRIDRRRLHDPELAHRYHRLEADWQVENAGCCQGCGREMSTVGDACIRCSTLASVVSDAERKGNLRAPNAAWKRHDREAGKIDLAEVLERHRDGERVRERASLAKEFSGLKVFPDGWLDEAMRDALDERLTLATSGDGLRWTDVPLPDKAIPRRATEVVQGVAPKDPIWRQSPFPPYHWSASYSTGAPLPRHPSWPKEEEPRLPLRRRLEATLDALLALLAPLFPEDCAEGAFTPYESCWEFEQHHPHVDGEELAEDLGRELGHLRALLAEMRADPAGWNQ